MVKIVFIRRDRFEDEKDRHYKDVHYNRPAGALTETVTDKEGNAYEIDQ